MPQYKDTKSFFTTLNANLSVKEYGTVPSGKGDAYRFEAKDYASAITESTNVGSTEGATTDWMITEDGLAYRVIPGEGKDCGTKSDINSADESASKACVIVEVDVDGLSTGLNTLQTQTLEENADLPKLTNDRYYIYIGNDGATAGSKKTSVTGRIAADLK